MCGDTISELADISLKGKTSNKNAITLILWQIWMIDNRECLENVILRGLWEVILNKKGIMS
jgi:hypothetical protein